jgi:hypothetical protein
MHVMTRMNDFVVGDQKWTIDLEIDLRHATTGDVTLQPQPNVLGDGKRTIDFFILFYRFRGRGRSTPTHSQRPLCKSLSIP